MALASLGGAVICGWEGGGGSGLPGGVNCTMGIVGHTIQ